MTQTRLNVEQLHLVLLLLLNSNGGLLIFRPDLYQNSVGCICKWTMVLYTSLHVSCTPSFLLICQQEFADWYILHLPTGFWLLFELQILLGLFLNASLHGHKELEVRLRKVRAVESKRWLTKLRSNCKTFWSNGNKDFQCPFHLPICPVFRVNWQEVAMILFPTLEGNKNQKKNFNYIKIFQLIYGVGLMWIVESVLVK